ncbi:MAG: hypothetical protein HIU86_06220 [Acidobacteria bacterium]|nr:hypothetical protein [Acidobacteriota bacterium]
MPFAPETLLEGPRGRFLCLTLAHELAGDVWPAVLHSAAQPFDVTRRAALVDALRGVDVGSLADRTDARLFADAMDATVTAAMGWQPPSEEDRLTADPDVLAALRPIAEAVADMPAAQWWASPLDPDHLVLTDRFDDRTPPRPARLTGLESALDRWRRIALEDEERARIDRPDDPGANWSGTWWSTPSGVALPVTTRRLERCGSVALLWEEDSLGQRDAILQPVRPNGAVRVFEIHGPGAWTALAAGYPFDVSRARRQDWFRVTGRDGAWIIPDWQAVARDWDAVHVSVLGYLRTATRALAVDDTRATMLAGWDPDSTWWLTAVLGTGGMEAERWSTPADTSGPLLEWRRIDPSD